MYLHFGGGGLIDSLSVGIFAWCIARLGGTENVLQCYDSSESYSNKEEAEKKLTCTRLGVFTLLCANFSLILVCFG